MEKLTAARILFEIVCDMGRSHLGLVSINQNIEDLLITQTAILCTE